MFRWLGRALSSSIGKKAVTAITGLALIGFLIEHLHGNLKLYQGEAFDDYVAWLQGFGPLLLIGEIGLALLFVVHIVSALRVSLENRQARRTTYVVRSDRGAQTLSSASMIVTGALLLGFLVKHVWDFRFDAQFFEGPRALVEEKLGAPGNAAIYVAASLALALHLRHGFRSAFQSLGGNHPKVNRLLEALALLAALVFGLGFASFPLYFLFVR